MTWKWPAPSAGSRQTVTRVLFGPGKLESRQFEWTPAPSHLSLAEREEISLGARRPKIPKLAAGPLCSQVSSWLEEWWSPEEIARRLRIDFPDDATMWVSHETIYQSLFVQGRGDLRGELSRCLRTGRAQRRPRGRTAVGGQIANMVMVSDRPAEAEDRAVPGHWEGDLIIGKDGRSRSESERSLRGAPATCSCYTCPMVDKPARSTRR